jgi:hypothetical protein
MCPNATTSATATATGPRADAAAAAAGSACPRLTVIAVGLKDLGLDC